MQRASFVSVSSKMLPRGAHRSHRRAVAAAAVAHALVVRVEDETPRSARRVLDERSGQRMTPAKVRSIVKKYLSMVTTQQRNSPHVLRHTFATAMLNHKADLQSVKELLGHESLSTTEIYTHTTFEQLKEMYNQAHPRAKTKGGNYGN